MTDTLAACVIGNVFRDGAHRFKDKPAFVMPCGRSISFATIYERVCKLNSVLESRGVSAGERVGILSRNRIEYIEAYGVSMSGLIALPLNWRLSPRELLAVLRDAEPTVIIVDADMRRIVEELKEELGFIKHFVCFDGSFHGWDSYEGFLEIAPGGNVHKEISPDSTACLMYTSGTTGTPKGAELTHRGLLLNCRTAITEMLELSDADITLAPMPFFHVGGMWYHLFPSFAAGCTTIIVPQFDPQLLLELMSQHGVTNTHLVPTMLHTLLEQPNIDHFDLTKLRLMFYAASSMPTRTLTRALAKFRCEFAQGYGSTEGGMITCLSAKDHRAIVQGREELLLSCGRALDGVELKLLFPSNACAGRIGEIAIRSNMTMAGYWRNGKASEKVVQDGWFRTGDLGEIDSSGYLYILDRKNDMIVTGGENVYPREVEDILLQDPNIAEAAVFDLPDSQWVQKVVAAVVLKEEADIDAILTRAKSKLAGYKCPKELFVTTALPKNAAGKVLRKVLRETYWSDDLPSGRADRIR